MRTQAHPVSHMRYYQASTATTHQEENPAMQRLAKNSELASKRVIVVSKYWAIIMESSLRHQLFSYLIIVHMIDTCCNIIFNNFLFWISNFTQTNKIAAVLVVSIICVYYSSYK